MELSEKQVFELSSEVLFQEVSGELVLLDMASESYFGLDEVGARVWSILGEGQSFGQVLDRLLEEYDVDRATLESDVAALLDSLKEAGLISVPKS